MTDDIRKFITPGPPLVVREQIKQIDPAFCDITMCCDTVVNAHVQGGRFGRWTVRDRERLCNVLHTFRSCIQSLMSGGDVSDDLHRAWAEARTIAQGAGFTGIQAVKEVLLTWLGSIYSSVDMPDWT